VDLGLSNTLIGALTSAEGGRTELSRQGFRTRDLLYRVLSVRATGALVGTCVVTWIAFHRDAGNAGQFWLDVAFTPHLFAQALQQTAISLAVYRNRQGFSVVANLIGVSTTVFLALFLAWKGAALPWLLLAQSWGGFLSGSIIFGYFYLQFLKRKRAGASRRVVRFHGRGAWGGEAWQALVNDAWPYAITFGVFVLWQRLDQITASHLLGMERGGQYGMAVRLVAVPLLMASSASFALFPDLQRVGRDAPERIRTILGALSKLIWRYGIVVAVLILGTLALVLAPLVPKFRPALHLLPFFVPGIWGYWMQSFLVNSLFGLRLYRKVVAAHLAALAVYLPSLLFLTEAFGLHGVAASFDIFCLCMFYFSYRSAKSAGVLPRNFFLYGAFTAEEKELLAKLPFARGRRAGVSP
jgi:O-antigen/teichoic acid export membrane protein